MEHKYKIGDNVKIREDLIIDKRYGLSFVSDMAQYKGKMATITNIMFDGRYNIDLDGGGWNWTDEMFEDDKKAQTVDIGYCLDYCGHRVIQNVYYGGYVHDHYHVFCTTVDGANQYTLPVNSIDFVIPHKD